MIYDSMTIPTSSVNVSEKPALKQSISDLQELKYSSISAKTPVTIFNNFVAIDVETTGLSVSKNEIIEVSAIRFRNGIAVENFLTFTYPTRGIQPDAFEVNGISLDMVDGAPPFPYIANSLEEFIGSDNIVGHNLSFDLKFLYKYGVNFLKQKRRYYDTLKIASKILKRPKRKWEQTLESYETDYSSDYDIDNYKLSTLCDYYKIEMLESHRASDDCYAAGLLFIQLGVEYGAIMDPVEAEAMMQRILAEPEADSLAASETSSNKHENYEELTLFLDETTLSSLNNEAFIDYWNRVRLCAEQAKPTADPEYMKKVTDELVLIRKECSKRKNLTLNKPSFFEEASKNRWAHLLVGTLTMFSAILLLGYGAVFLGIISAIIAGVSIIFFIIGMLYQPNDEVGQD